MTIDYDAAPSSANLAPTDMSVDQLSISLVGNFVDNPIEQATVSSAISLATNLHDGQFRHENGEEKPYIVHPLRNALRITNFGCKDTDIVVAALLHDTVEDQAPKMYTLLTGLETSDQAKARAGALQLIRQAYGDSTANIVSGVTNLIELESETTTEDDRNRHYVEHVQSAIGEPGVFLVKFSDWVDNAGSLDQVPELATAQRYARKYFPLVSIFEQAFAEQHGRLPISLVGSHQIEEQLRSIAGDLQKLI